MVRKRLRPWEKQIASDLDGEGERKKRNWHNEQEYTVKSNIRLPDIL
jgi:hypothetical protein